MNLQSLLTDALTGKEIIFRTPITTHPPIKVDSVKVDIDGSLVVYSGSFYLRFPLAHEVEFITPTVAKPSTKSPKDPK